MVCHQLASHDMFLIFAPEAPHGYLLSIVQQAPPEVLCSSIYAVQVRLDLNLCCSRHMLRHRYLGRLRGLEHICIHNYPSRDHIPAAWECCKRCLACPSVGRTTPCSFQTLVAALLLPVAIALVRRHVHRPLAPTAQMNWCSSHISSSMLAPLFR